MRVFTLQMALCLTLLTLATTTAFAGVRGRPTTLKTPAPVSSRVAQNDADYSINAVPVPADVHVTNERVIHESKIPSAIPTNDLNCVTAAPMAARPNYVAVPMMVMPMMMPAAQPMPIPMQMPMMAAPGCASCGGISGGGGLSPHAAAAYDQAFGPGLYRSGAEMGQNHFPYYSYRRPWYFPGQPSFHRSTDYVW